MATKGAKPTKKKPVNPAAGAKKSSSPSKELEKIKALDQQLEQEKEKL